MNFKTRTLLSHQKKLAATTAHQRLNNASNFNVIPTFEEFLEFVLSTDLQGKIYFRLLLIAISQASLLPAR